MHSIIECVVDVQAALTGVASVEPAFMAMGEKRAALVALTQARSQLDALTARVLAAADDVGEVDGLRDAAAWLALRREPRGGRLDVTLPSGGRSRSTLGFPPLSRRVQCARSRRG